MLLSFSIIFLLGLSLGKIFEKLKLPKLLGMLLTGIIIGPYVLDIIDGKVLDISAELRKVALIIILTRAGLNLDIDDLKKVGRPAILMCFVPACLEILGMVILATKIIGVTILEALIIGTVVAAVSPAVIVPRMLHLMEEGYGKDKSIPQMVMAGASVDDVFVIVLFTTFTGLAKTGDMTLASLMTIPTSIILGIISGIIIGVVLNIFFKKYNVRDTEKVIIMLSISFILVALETALEGIVGYSGLLAIMALGTTLRLKNIDLAKNMSNKFSKLWVGAEILLFVLVGATVDISYAYKAGLVSIVLILGVLVFRIIGVFLCLIKTDLNKGEKLFTAFSYMPKATVQAAIGAIPLQMGLPCGEIALTIAVMSIIITSPLGAILIDNTYSKYLKKADL